MKKFRLVFALLFALTIVKAQTILTTEQNYQNLKANGQLIPTANYKIVNSPANAGSISNNPKLLMLL